MSFGYSGVSTKIAERLSASLPPVINGNGHQTGDFIFVDGSPLCCYLQSQIRKSLQRNTDLDSEF